MGLKFYTKYIKPKWIKPEWGFPKGRRDKWTEENLSCACREFEEKTGYKKNEYTVLNKIEPIEENLSSGRTVSATNTSIIWLSTRAKKNISDRTYDLYEIGDIKWFTYNEAMAHIRPYHVEKRKILTQVYLFLLNYLICRDS